MSIKAVATREFVWKSLSGMFLLLLLAIRVAHADGIVTDNAVTRVEYQGLVYEVEDGLVYEVTGQTRNPLFTYYDPGFVAANYLTDSNGHFRLVDGYGYVPTRNNYTESFENIGVVTDLIGPSPANWTSMTLLSPAAPSVADYVALRSMILNSQSDYLDNRIDMTSSRAHDGQSAARFFAVPPSGGLILTKSSLDNELVYFEKGDIFRFSAFFYAEQGRPSSIMDLESSYIEESPGIRIMLDEDWHPFVELKFATKPLYTMELPTEIKFPVNQWVNLELEVFLSDSDSEGRVQLWMNGSKIIDKHGRTLTLFDAVYNSLQVGITATSSDAGTVLYVDQLQVSDLP